MGGIMGGTVGAIIATPSPSLVPMHAITMTGHQQHQQPRSHAPLSLSNSGADPGPSAQVVSHQIQTAVSRPVPDQPPPVGQPVLYLLSLNGTFDRKTLSIPFAPNVLRIGRQTNPKTVPSSTNGYFDSKVLSRQHAEIWAHRNGKILIRDIKSSNGTFVNGKRLSLENRESEPHELNTADDLELGIDIVHEDQKTVMHHKVAAKVEHAGFLSHSNNLLEMNLGDLDPANGAVGSSASQLSYNRSRVGSTGSNSNQSRPVPLRSTATHSYASQANQAGVAQQHRPFWLTCITTDHVVRKLQNEIRSARLQSQDLSRTGQLISAFLSKEDIRDMEESDDAEPGRLLQIDASFGSGHGMSFPVDSKARFSDPPAPPPQQPLPEKPVVPSLKRNSTERPKEASLVNYPSALQDHHHQILVLTEALNNVRKDFYSQSARVHELEGLLREERAAREIAEDVAKRFVEATNKPRMIIDDLIGEAFESLRSMTETLKNEQLQSLKDTMNETWLSQDDTERVSQLSPLLGRLDTHTAEFGLLTAQLETWKKRCGDAEAERDGLVKTLAEMVMEAKQEVKDRQAVADQKARSRSRRRRSQSRNLVASNDRRRHTRRSAGASDEDSLASEIPNESIGRDDNDDSALMPSRIRTVRPPSLLEPRSSGRAMAEALPYASMLGVVLIGMGLMAYLNGWQPPPKALR